MLNRREVIKPFLLLLYIFEKFHLKKLYNSAAWRMCCLLMVGGVGVEGRQQPQHLLSLHCPECTVHVRPFCLAKHDPQMIYEF